MMNVDVSAHDPDALLDSVVLGVLVAATRAPLAGRGMTPVEISNTLAGRSWRLGQGSHAFDVIVNADETEVAASLLRLRDQTRQVSETVLGSGRWVTW